MKIGSKDNKAKFTGIADEIFLLFCSEWNASIQNNCDVLYTTNIWLRGKRFKYNLFNTCKLIPYDTQYNTNRLTFLPRFEFFCHNQDINRGPSLVNIILKSERYKQRFKHSNFKHAIL